MDLNTQSLHSGAIFCSPAKPWLYWNQKNLKIRPLTLDYLTYLVFLGVIMEFDQKIVSYSSGRPGHCCKSLW